MMIRLITIIVWIAGSLLMTKMVINHDRVMKHRKERRERYQKED